MTVPVTVSPLDPNCLLQGIARPLIAVVRSGVPVFDQDYGEFARWIYVGQAGNLQFTDWAGNTVFLPNLTVGLHPWASIRIQSANTTIPANMLVWGS